MTMIWQLQEPLDAVLFDCDGTLSTIEGIDELARHNQVGEEVSALTHEAMTHSGINPALYTKRLQLIKPSREQIHALGKHYIATQTVDAANIIAILLRLKKSMHILSAGLLPAVKMFGEQIGIPDTNIHAVDIYFDGKGHYLDFDHQSPLIHNDGKYFIAAEIQKKYPRMIHLGDGLNDFSTYDLVTRFVGYGGIFYREKFASLCDFYIRSTSLASFLPLCLTAAEVKALLPSEKLIYQKGVDAIQQGRVLMK